MARAAHAATDIDGPPGRKSVLFCLSCEHASPVDGDWVLRERATSVEFRCPDCGAVLTERDREQGCGRPTNPTLRLWSAWLRAATVWVRLAGSTSVPPGARSATPRWRR